MLQGLQRDNLVYIAPVVNCSSSSGPCQQSFSLLPNTTYSVLMTNGGGPYTASYGLTFHAPGSAGDEYHRFLRPPFDYSFSSYISNGVLACPAPSNWLKN